MQKPIVSLGLLGLVVALPLSLAARPATVDDEPGIRGGLATLYSRDPLARTLSFYTGEYGGVFHDHMVKNHQSDIDFGNYYADEFTVGIEGGYYGQIVDLGSTQHLQAEYGFEETVGGGQGFASIHVDDGEWMILDNYDAESLQPLKESSVLYEDAQKGSHAPVNVGHIYLVRLLNRHDSEFERLVKFLVVAYAPGESVTIRWQRIK